MSGNVTPIGKDLIMSGNLDLTKEEIWVELTLNGASAGHDWKKLANQRVLQSEGATIFDADDIEWSTSGIISANGCVLYSSSPWGAGVPIVTFDFGPTHTAANGTFSIKWSDDGLFRIPDDSPIPRNVPLDRDTLVDAIETYLEMAK